MSTKKPRILLRIGPNRLATVINVPTDESNLESKASPPASPSGDMAATSAELTQGKAAQKSGSKLPSSKMAPQRQYRSQKKMRNLRNHHSGPTTSSTIADDTKGAQVVTPPETATNSGTELRHVDEHEEIAASSRKRARREPSVSVKAEIEENITKKRVALLKDISVIAAPATKVQGVTTEQRNANKRSLRSQDPRKISELAALFQEDAFPVYVAKNEPILIVEDEPDAIPRVVKKPGEGEASEASSSSNHHFIPQPPPTPITPIPAARTAPIGIFDFSQFEKKAARFVNDPLKDAHYELPHKRHAMKEKRWRNIENEKSQQLYNKLRNELEKLKGPEWFKVLGFNRANPDAIAKKEHLIISIEKELSKQRRFAEELRKQKRAKAERTTSPEHPKPSTDRRRSRSTTRENDGDEDVEGERPSKLRKMAPASEAKTEERPFTSFFSKEHLRNAAMKNWRKSGRHAQAFGQQLPPIPQTDFDFTFPLSLVEEVTKTKAP